MKDFHPRKIVLWVHVLPLTINGSCCLLVRSAAWLRGFRVSPESDGATRAVRVGRRRVNRCQISTCVRYTLYRTYVPYTVYSIVN